MNRLNEKPIVNGVSLSDFIVGIIGGQVRRFPVSLFNSSSSFKGNALRSTDPGQPSNPEWWFATDGTGMYSHFNGLVVTKNFAILSFNGSDWQLFEQNIGNISNNHEPVNSFDPPVPADATFFKSNDYVYHRVDNVWKRNILSLF
jgi:hypothetical protein